MLGNQTKPPGPCTPSFKVVSNESHDLKEAYLVQLDNVWMVQHLHDLDLSVDLLQVNSIQLSLVDYLDGHLQKECVSTTSNLLKSMFISKSK